MTDQPKPVKRNWLTDRTPYESSVRKERARARTKVCKRCGNAFTKRQGQQNTDWPDRKYCSHECYIAARDDRPRSEKAIRHAAAVRKWQAKNPHKLRAHGLLAKAIARGNVKPQPCETCGTRENVHAHHKDYSRPLDVSWLCALHHFDDHSKAGDLVRDRESAAS